MNTWIRNTLAVALLGALGGMAGAQQPPGTYEQARVVSSTPIVQWVASGASGEEQQRTVGYNVTYEVGGRRYTTQTAEPPGATIPVQVSALGVTTPVASPGAPAAAPPAAPDASAWQNVVPEPGVVVPPAGAAPAYAQPVYVQPAYPVYVAPPMYGYGYAPYVAPIGLSLNLGYSRGWGGGWRHWR